MPTASPLLDRADRSCLTSPFGSSGAPWSWRPQPVAEWLAIGTLDRGLTAIMCSASTVKNREWVDIDRDAVHRHCRNWSADRKCTKASMGIQCEIRVYRIIPQPVIGPRMAALSPPVWRWVIQGYGDHWSISMPTGNICHFGPLSAEKKFTLQEIRWRYIAAVMDTPQRGVPFIEAAAGKKKTSMTAPLRPDQSARSPRPRARSPLPLDYAY